MSLRQSKRTGFQTRFVVEDKVKEWGSIKQDLSLTSKGAFVIQDKVKEQGFKQGFFVFDKSEKGAGFFNKTCFINA